MTNSRWTEFLLGRVSCDSIDVHCSQTRLVPFGAWETWAGATSEMPTDFRPSPAIGREPRASGDDRGARTRVLIADDCDGSRSALRALLTTFPGIEVIGEASDGAEALCMSIAQHPDVVLMDVRMPGLNGIQATKLIKAKCPGVTIVVLSMHSRYKAIAYGAGADTFLVKGCPAESFLEALER